jgi:hypothetical protein
VLAMRLAILFGLASVLAFGAAWSGVLVDARCYAAEQRNVNPHDALTNVDRDRDQEIWYCAPRSKTKTFAVVQRNGLSFNLDAGGNTKAAELVRNAGKKSLFSVAVTGQMTGNTVRVDTISKVN